MEITSKDFEGYFEDTETQKLSTEILKYLPFIILLCISMDLNLMDVLNGKHHVAAIPKAACTLARPLKPHGVKPTAAL